VASLLLLGGGFFELLRSRSLQPPYGFKNLRRRIRDWSRLTCSFWPLLSVATWVPPGIMLTWRNEVHVRKRPRPSLMTRAALQAAWHRPRSYELRRFRHSKSFANSSLTANS